MVHPHHLFLTSLLHVFIFNIDIFRYPDVDDLVVTKVCSCGDMGWYVKLLEYGDIEAMVLDTMRRRRLRLVRRRVRPGQIIVRYVQRVDRCPCV